MSNQKDCNNCCSLFLRNLPHEFCVNSHSSESGHIGCAMKWSLESVRASRYPNQPWNMVAGLRHRLVHVYDGINWSIIVEVVFEDMEPFVQDLRNIGWHVNHISRGIFQNGGVFSATTRQNEILSRSISFCHLINRLRWWIRICGNTVQIPQGCHLKSCGIALIKI